MQKRYANTWKPGCPAPVEKKPAVGVLGIGGTYGNRHNVHRENQQRAASLVGWYKGAVESHALIAAGYGAVIAGEEDPATSVKYAGD